jgi:hypothetical protein
MTYLGIIIFISCSSYLVFAGRRLLTVIAFVRNSRLTTGVVIELEPLVSPVGYFSPSAYTKGYYPVVEFTANKKKIRIKGDVPSKPAPYKVGEVFAVRYLAENPNTAKISTLLQLWGESLMTISGSLIFALVGLAIIGVFK